MSVGRLGRIAHPDDNVATVLDDAISMEQLIDGRPVAPGLPFGHKVALTAIPKGAPVIKYGIEIGRAVADISAGEHVHVHNLR